MADKYSAQHVADAITRSRGVLAAAAQMLGCSRQTVHTYTQKYALCRDAVRDSRESMTDIAEGALYRAITNGEAWAVCFYLKTQAKDRGYVERQEVQHAGSDGGPLTFTLRIDQAADRLELSAPEAD